MSGDKVRENDLIVESYFVMCVQKFMLTNTHFNDIIILFMGIIMDLNVYTAISVLNAMM